MAASWDPETIERGQSVAAREARAVGIHWTFAPMVDIARDPRWGRIIEGAGEDPYLGAAVAAAQVRGFQGGELGAPDHIIAGPKHFAGYGAALGGRDYDEVNLSDSELWNVYFPPFKAAVEAGAGQRDDRLHGPERHPRVGQPVAVHRGAARHVGVRRLRGQRRERRAKPRDPRLRGRSDRCRRPRASTPASTWRWRSSDPAYGHLPEALESGAANAEAVDASVRRVLEAKLRMGLFDAPYVDEDRAREVLADPAHRDVARIAAERSAVLLRNEGDLLPLDAGSLSSIAVIGPLADSKRDTLGPWVFDFDLDETVTVLDGIRARVGDAVRVEHARGVPVVQRVFPSLFDMFGGNTPEDPEGFDEEAEFQRAVELARAADVAVVVVGRVAEHDRRDGLAVVAGAARDASSSCCRPSSRPARRSCCWS